MSTQPMPGKPATNSPDHSKNAPAHNAPKVGDQKPTPDARPAQKT